MFGAVNILLIFLFYRTSNGQLQFPDSEYATHIPSTSNHSYDTAALPLLDLQGGDNVQKLVPKNTYFNKETNPEDDEKNLGPDGPALPGKRKPGKDGSVASQNVYRVQELTGQLWPMGVVPFYVDKKIYDATTVKRITKAMSVIESVSCVIFRELEKKPVNSNDAWLYFTNPKQERECVHVFSTVDFGTEVVLGFDCLHPDEILHSLLHALGFRDEVTHPHRDQYIRVLWNNIKPKYRQLFRIRHEDASYKLVEYDPMSIMHFHDRAFSDNGAATIAALVPGLQIHSSTTLSQLDIMRLKLAFSHECNKRNIGDLLITCKKTLTPQNKSHGKAPEEPDEDHLIVAEKVEDDLTDQGVNDEEQNVANVETPQAENKNEHLEEEAIEERGVENENEQFYREVKQAKIKELQKAKNESLAGEERPDNSDLAGEGSEEMAGEANEDANKNPVEGNDVIIPNRFQSLNDYKSRGG